MDERGPRTPAGAIASLPMAGLLGFFFFMPWLTVSCDPKAAIPAAELAKMPHLPAGAAEAKEIAQASGWELARGEISPAEDCARQPKPAGGNQEFPKPKYWVYLGLAVPVGLLIVAVLGISHSLSWGGAGKIMLVLGVAGVVVMLVAASIDYVDDALDQSKDEMAKRAPGMVSRPGGMAFDAAVSQAGDKMREVLKTKATWYLWGSLGLYGLVVVCGLATVLAGEAPSEEWRHTHVETTLGASRPGPGATIHQAPPTRPSGLPDFGPNLTPPSPSETNNPATFRKP